jgi:hypothetical protein
MKDAAQQSVAPLKTLNVTAASVGFHNIEIGIQKKLLLLAVFEHRGFDQIAFHGDRAYLIALGCQLGGTACSVAASIAVSLSANAGTPMHKAIAEQAAILAIIFMSFLLSSPTHCTLTHPETWPVRAAAAIELWVHVPQFVTPETRVTGEIPGVDCWNLPFLTQDRVV